MRRLRDFSIQSKVILITMLANSVALALVSAAFVGYDWVSLRRAHVRDLGTLAEIIGANCSAALVFDDPGSAVEIVNALRAERMVTHAGIFDRRGAPFARYARDAGAGPGPATAPADGVRFARRRLELVRPIVLDGERVGTIALEADLRDLYVRVGRYAGIVALVALLSGSVAFALSTRLQRLVSQPILALAQVAKAVSQRKDYTVRGTKDGEDEVGTLIDGFNEMLGEIQGRDAALVERSEQLAAANRELESFTYSVSHDLRVPVRAVNGLCQVLEEDHAGSLNAEGKRLVGLMRHSATNMTRLIDDLLEFSRLGRREMHAEVVDVEALARAVAAELLALEPERRVAVEIAALPPAHGDAALVRQVLVNLISNALKFTRKRADAAVYVGVEAHGPETVYYVRDNGVGFDMKYAHKLFNVFQRLHAARDFEGTGVGLAIVARVVARHGGRVWAEARPGAGATFWFTLPAPER